MHKDPLLQPFQLKHLTLKNRIMTTSHEPAYPEDGMPKERYRAYHEERAKGGIALAMTAGSSNRYFQKNHNDKSKFVPEGVEARVPYKGSVNKILYQLQGGLRSSMGYIGAKMINEIQKKGMFIKITKAGFYESMVHSVETTDKEKNYKL